MKSGTAHHALQQHCLSHNHPLHYCTAAQSGCGGLLAIKMYSTFVQKISFVNIFLQIAETGGHPVVAVKTARVGDFNGKTLSTLSTSLVEIDPDVTEAGMLRNW